jgi:glucose/arabinose dehydrogenase
MRRKILIVLLVLVFIGFATLLAREKLIKIPDQNLNQKTNLSSDSSIEVIASNLEIPWEVAFLPNNEILVTERPGRILKIGKNRQVIEIEGVAHIGEGGLLGLALHPDFEENSQVFLYLTTKTGDQVTNRVEQYRLEGDRLVEREIIVEGIAGSAIHDGGRIAFGPDDYLYITTGDAGDKSLAQVASEVYSYGHRNSQGLAWDDAGRLWVTEHGPSGLQSGLDEINLIEKGSNYGWPVVRGDETQEGMISPVMQSGSTITWAPAGVAFWDGSLFFGGLRGEALYEYLIETGELKDHLKGEFGRIRAVVLGPDEFLYITTSNRDGRGTPQREDDKLVRINPNIFR